MVRQISTVGEFLLFLFLFLFHLHFQLRPTTWTFRRVRGAILFTRRAFNHVSPCMCAYMGDDGDGDGDTCNDGDMVMVLVLVR